MTRSSVPEAFAAWDARLVAAARSVKILTSLGWPPAAREEFLEGWHAKRPRLPAVPCPQVDLTAERAELETLSTEVDANHPVGAYLAATARSYATAARMLESAGTPAFTELSRELYGAPGDRIGSSRLTSLDAARAFVGQSSAFEQSCHDTDEDYCVLATAVAAAIAAEAERVFTDAPVRVEIDPGLSSKAAAGANRVRVRGSTCFSPRDVAQLVQHELLVHTLTMQNGRAQPHLGSLGLGAPRTTRTQEGIAVFAELITTAMDLGRLRRIALRVLATQLALDGADFIDVFRFFLEAGQVEVESYQSASRIFRGGDPAGGVIFMKDCSYLGGVLGVHNFLRKAIAEGKTEYPRYLFAGRLDLADIVALEPFFREGYLAPPVRVPDWLRDRSRLTAFLVYSNFVHEVGLTEVSLES